MGEDPRHERRLVSALVETKISCDVLKHGRLEALQLIVGVGRHGVGAKELKSLGDELKSLGDLSPTYENTP